MWTVYKADRVIIPGLADRNGIRYIISGTGNHVERMVKYEVGVDMGWLEAKAKEALSEKLLGIVEMDI